MFAILYQELPSPSPKALEIPAAGPSSSKPKQSVTGPSTPQSVTGPSTPVPERAPLNVASNHSAGISDIVFLISFYYFGLFISSFMY